VIQGFGQNPIAIASEHRDAPGVFLTGSANETLGGLPRPEEKVGINANSVSLFANVGRNKALANYLAYLEMGNAEKAPLVAERAAQLEQLTQQTYRREPVELLNGGVDRVTVAVEDAQINGVRRVQAAELALRVGLDQTFSKVRLPQGKSELVLELIRQEGVRGYELQFKNAAYGEVNVAALGRQLSQNAILNSVLLRDYFAKQTGIRSLEVSIPVRVDGTLDVAKMNIATRRR
jgi:hypothetical protein